MILPFKTTYKTYGLEKMSLNRPRINVLIKKSRREYKTNISGKERHMATEGTSMYGRQ
jgi:Na+-transporting NADH:ubiquinone oxidoreductase subunit NqrA